MARRSMATFVTGLSAGRGDETCSNLAAPGEHLIVSGSGFTPGSPVTLFLEASTEDGRRSATTVADGLGVVTASVLVPDDLNPDPRAFEAALAMLQVSAADVLFVDDQPFNLTGSIVSGIDSVEFDVVDPAGAVAMVRTRLGLDRMAAG